MSRFYAHPELGVEVPSVTTILNVINKPLIPRWASKKAAEAALAEPRRTDESEEAYLKRIAGAPWKQMEKAGNTGTLIHQYFERVLKDDTFPLPKVNVSPQELECMAALHDWVVENRVRLIASESTVFDPLYAGTFDALIWYDERVLLTDLKTGRAVYPEYTLQLAGYRFAEKIQLPDKRLIDMVKVDGAAVIHLNKETATVELIEVEADEHAHHVFLAALDLWHWLEGAK